MLYIGVDLGGTGIKAGVVDERGEILSKGSTPTMKERPYQAIIRDIAALCEDVAKQANVAMADIAAIGVGVPGICDPKTGIIPFCTNLGWHEVPFVAEMGKYLPNRVVVDNDATVAGYAESIAGVSKGTKSSVFITLGTGVGGGVVLGGKLLTGYTGAASELGHMVIAENGEECTCGSRGCFEAYSSATALIRDTKRAMAAHPKSLLHTIAAENGGVDGRTAFLAKERGDEAGTQVVENYIEHLTCALTNLVNIFFPEVLALSGGVANQGEVLLAPLREKVRARSFGARYAASHTRIELCTLGYRAGMIGAAMLARV